MPQDVQEDGCVFSHQTSHGIWESQRDLKFLKAITSYFNLKEKHY